MKCIHCQTNNSYRERTANRQRCSNCRRSFAFEPKRERFFKLSDSIFHGIIEKTSLDGQLFFTERQLWYAFNQWIRRKYSPSVASIFPLLLFGLVCFFFLYLTNFELPFAMFFGIILFSILGRLLFNLWQFRRLTPRLSFDDFREKYLRRWVEAHGAINHLLPPPERLNYGQPSATQEPDLTAYSFDRVLVVDNDAIAAMLIANHVHMENRCAIVSANGYPQTLFNPLLTMLRRNPRLTIFILHDATPQSLDLPQRLRRSAWFPDPQMNIIDLGLRPKTADKLRFFVLQDSPPSNLTLTDSLRGALTEAELTWFKQGKWAELASFAPNSLIQALSRGITQASQALTTRNLPDDDAGSSTAATLVTAGGATFATLMLLDDPFERQIQEERQARAAGSWMSSDFG